MKSDVKKILDIIVGIYFSLVGIAILFIGFLMGYRCYMSGCELQPYMLILLSPIAVITFFISYKMIKGIGGNVLSIVSIIFSASVLAFSIWMYWQTIETSIVISITTINLLFTILAVIRYFLIIKPRIR